MSHMLGWGKKPSLSLGIHDKNRSNSMEMNMEQKNSVTIEYCSKCKFMMRSAWVAQELLQTFEGDIDEAVLKPSKVPGIWRIYANGQQVWDRKTERGLPEMKNLKRRVRDVIAPEKDLGHAETVEPEG